MSIAPPRLRDPAEPSVERVHPLSFLPAFLGDREPVAHVDALDDQHAVLGLDLADGLDLVAVGIDFDFTRLQRAGEAAVPVSRRRRPPRTRA